MDPVLVGLPELLDLDPVAGPARTAMRERTMLSSRACRQARSTLGPATPSCQPLTSESSRFSELAGASTQPPVDVGLGHLVSTMGLAGSPEADDAIAPERCQMVH